MPRVPIVKRSKHWCFTINNPRDEDCVTSDKIAYIIYGREVSATGTKHLQGYVCFVNRQRLSAVKKLFPRAHLEVRVGTIREAIQYCKKDGDFTEEGEVPLTPREATINRWVIAKQYAKEGNFDAIPAQMLMRYYHAFKRYHQDNPTIPENLVARRNKWIVAPSGYGKSTYAREKYSDFYDKAPNKWFVGYKDQSTILCDDFGPKQCEYLGWYMKRWADIFPFPMETKGGGKMIRPQRIVVTSQYTIRDCFEDELVREAIQNRFEVVELDHWERRRQMPVFHFGAPLNEQYESDDESMEVEELT